MDSELPLWGLLVFGVLLGATLNYFQYGFSSSFRALLTQRNTLAARSLLIMLGVAIGLFTLIQAFDPSTERTLLISPVSMAVAVGAFIFGIGMQLNHGGCTSGTLNRTGQLQPLSFASLLALIVGATLAAYSFDDWNDWPKLESYAWQFEFGIWTGLLLQLGLLFILYKVLWKLDANSQRLTIKHPFFAAGVLLAFLNAGLFAFYLAPWSIASVFPYWGIGLIEVFDLPIDWSFWNYSMNQTQLETPFWEHRVNLMAIGLIGGALLVTLMQKQRNWQQPIELKHLAWNSLGGLIMGYGAVMASGCNIGALFSGIASGSLHGWEWLFFALIGNAIGVKIRARWIE